MNGKGIIACVIAAVVGFVAGYGFQMFRGDRTTADDVRKQLDGIKASQQESYNSLDGAARAAEEQGRLIDECKSILRQIRTQPAPEN